MVIKIYGEENIVAATAAINKIARSDQERERKIFGKLNVSIGTGSSTLGNDLNIFDYKEICGLQHELLISSLTIEGENFIKKQI